MISLRNFDSVNQYFDFETNTECTGNYNKIYGWYKHINGLLSALLVIDNQLYFLFDHNKILVTDDHRVLLKSRNELEKELILLKKDDEIIRFSYLLPNLELNVSPFEYLDDEDFKWGDFIEKIINDRDRKRNSIANLMEE